MDTYEKFLNSLPQMNTVYHTDALTLLNALERGAVAAAAVITDPPYGLGNRTFTVGRDMKKSDGHGARPDNNYVAIKEDWDKEAPVDWMRAAQSSLSEGANVLICGGMESSLLFGGEGLRLGWRLNGDIVWEKNNPPPNFTGRALTISYERILWFCPDGTRWTYNSAAAKAMNNGVNLRDIWRFPIPKAEQRVHPAQKPIDLMERLIRLFTNPDDLVVDPFCGSGTTLVAARNTGRRYIGCDISADYAAMAGKRLALPFTAPLFAEEHETEVQG